MNANIVSRWEEWRELRGGDARHRRAVDTWLQSHPAVLYWGDSWFSTPLYPNLARQSAMRIDGLCMIVGKPGATAAELLVSRQVSKMMDRLKANPFDALCISAGGNDALSERLEGVFSRWMHGRPARISAAAAFDLLLQSKLFERLTGRYRFLLDAVQASVLKTRPAFKVIGQTYAPLNRIGVSGDLTIKNIGLIATLKDSVGPWLYGPMKRVLTNEQEAHVFAKLLLVDGFKKSVLDQLAREYAGLFSYADISSLGSLDDAAYWYDEIHPTADGFALCAPLFNAAVRAALPAQKQPAVG